MSPLHLSSMHMRKPRRGCLCQFSQWDYSRHWLWTQMISCLSLFEPVSPRKVWGSCQVELLASSRSDLFRANRSSPWVWSREGPFLLDMKPERGAVGKRRQVHVEVKQNTWLIKSHEDCRLDGAFSWERLSLVFLASAGQTGSQMQSVSPREPPMFKVAADTWPSSPASEMDMFDTTQGNLQRTRDTVPECVWKACRGRYDTQSPSFARP